jgi:DNA polymerase III delta prime subunit
MTSFLIISKTISNADRHALDITKQYNIDSLDITYLATEGTIGIEEVRNLQKKLMLKPFKSENKAAIIKNAQDLTLEAQNAFLKTLEEPPNHTYIFLLAQTNSTLLPTILSRCTIIELNEFIEISAEETKLLTEQIQNSFSASIGSNLKLAEKISTNKNTALQWLEKATICMRQILLGTVNNHQISNENALLVSFLQNMQKTYKIIKTTNVSPRLAVENLFLNS